MSTVQVADQTFVAAPGTAVAEVLSDRGRWRLWWPDLTLDVREDRGDKGIRWTVAGPMDGTMEVWLEPCLDGVILHYFLHAEPGDASRLSARDLAALNRPAGRGQEDVVRDQGPPGGLPRRRNGAVIALR